MKTQYILGFALCILSGALFGQDAVTTNTAPALQPGFYLGGQLGYKDYTNACEPHALSCDQDGGIWGAFGGYRVGQHFSLEAGYLNLNEVIAVYPRLTNTVSTTGEMEGYDLSLLLALPFAARWQVYARAGAFNWQAKLTRTTGELNDSGWSPSAGAGITWQFHRSWQARFQYQYLGALGNLAMGEANGQLVMLGLSYFFSGQPKAVVIVPAPALPESQPATLPALLQTFFFAFDSAEPKDIEALKPLADRLRKYPQALVSIVGYTDSAGSKGYNLGLSMRRARAIATYLTEQGVAASQISVDWRGNAEPLVLAMPGVSEARNRRVVVISPALELPIDDTEHQP